MKFNEYLAQHAVFTVAEFARFLSDRGSGNPNTRKSLLMYHQKQGRVIPVRRGLYATVPPGSNPATSPVDPYLIAAKATPDAVLAYHTALEFHGKAYSLYTKLFFVTVSKSVPFKFRGHDFKAVLTPQPLREQGKEMFGVETLNRSGVEVRVTNLERCLVDALDRPELTGSWEEIWRSLESIEFFDVDRVVEYVLLLANATTAAKVGFYLEQHKESLMVEDSHLEPLRKLRPRQPHYMVRGNRKNCQWVKSWNLLVPKQVLNKSWEEVL